ncbi:MAG: IS1595 family transposase [Gaiellaceae bacterium]
MPPANRKNPERAKSSQSLYSLREFQRDFPDDDACLEWLWRERFSPDGEHAHCPKCDESRRFKRYATKQQRQSWTCTACGHHLHPTAGTIFAKSSRPLTDWFYVMFLVSSSRCGIAAKQIERELGCNYKTAWRMLNIVRNKLMAQDDERLSGEVEADESFFGGRPHAYPKRAKNAHWDKKPIIFAAVERGGRMKAQVVASSRGPVVTGKVHELVLPKSILFTDEYHAYKRLGREGFSHRRVNHGAKVYVDGDTHTQTVEGFFGLFKTGVRGTHHAISARWLQGYLNEWVWRWDRRHDDEAMFKQLLTSSITTS